MKWAKNTPQGETKIPDPKPQMGSTGGTPFPAPKRCVRQGELPLLLRPAGSATSHTLPPPPAQGVHTGAPPYCGGAGPTEGGTARPQGLQPECVP